MKTENTGIFIGRYACYVVTIIYLLFGLAIMLLSCERELPGGADGSGEKVLVSLSVTEMPYSAGEGLRSSGLPEVPETVVTHVYGDMYMYATLSPVEASPTRSSSPLAPGTKLIIAAYKVINNVRASSATDYARYEISGSAVVPAGSEAPLEIEKGDYEFVAYSLNSTTDFPANPETVSNINSSRDLLWGVSAKTSIDDTHNTVNIQLKHQFSWVTLWVTTDNIVSNRPDIIGLSSASVNPGYTADLTVYNGNVAPTVGVYGSNSLTMIPSTPTKWVSTARTVYTAGANPTIINLYNVVIKGVNGGALINILRTSFAMTMEPGKEYNLTVDFKLVEFAGSNIYWASTKAATATARGEGRLTFDLAGNNTNNRYQGVFFKWGSLVGISGALAGGLATMEYGTAGNATTGTPIYIPHASSPTGYYQTNARSQGWSTWASPTAGVAAAATEIPYFDGSYAQSFGRTSDFVSASDQNTSAVWAGYRGDICQYINAAYRLPMSYEFGAYNNSWNYASDGTTPIGWTRYPTGTNSDFPASNNALGDPVGKSTNGTINTGATTYRGIFFPVSGFRDAITGQLYDVANHSDYWSSSAYSNGVSSYGLYLVGSSIEPSNNFRRSFAFPIRCVKK